MIDCSFVWSLNPFNCVFKTMRSEDPFLELLKKTYGVAFISARYITIEGGEGIKGAMLRSDINTPLDSRVRFHYPHREEVKTILVYRKKLTILL